MLMLSVLLFVLPFVTQTASINLTYILKKANNKLQPTCLAQDNERYKGVGWVYPIPDSELDLPKITTKFVPNLHHDYDCDFAKHQDCNLRWKLPDWKIDDESQRTFGFISDGRWEELPTILTSNQTKEFKVEVPETFKLGFSVRTGMDVEVLFCNGWNPKTYPCYKIKIQPTQISLEKTDNLPKTKTSGLPYLDSYAPFSLKILAEDEWRNFIVSFNDAGNEKLILHDININRTVLDYKITDNDNIKPTYLIIQSTNSALWKVHQKSFLYTETLGTYRFGPSVLTASKDLCIYFYISTCQNCLTTFFIQSQGQPRKTLKIVQPTGEDQWLLVKLKQENLPDNTVTIFIQTSFQDEKLAGKGFWAIDNVRVCHENEVKISYLDFGSNKIAENHQEAISCQLITQPNWRPKKLEYDNVKDFLTVNFSSTQSAIKLKWTDEDPKNLISYFISYQANDLCDLPPHNEKRLRSNGFHITNYNEITLENLVPYTHYNVVISSVLHNIDKRLDISTLEDDNIQISEYPQVRVQAKKVSIYGSWDKVDCSVTYGHVYYNIQVKNDKLKFVKEITQTENTFHVTDLKSLTAYQLTIKMGRKHDDLNHVVFEQNFTTLPDVAPSLVNLEIYAIGKNVALFRYDLPKDTKGEPSAVRVNRCLSISKCKQFYFNITPCVLWPNKYCFRMPDLMEQQQYNFQVSLKNFNTPQYGKEVSVVAYTMDKVPGTPSNITYEFVDCQNNTNFCNLNLTWLHPDPQNGTITEFNIVLLNLNRVNNRKGQDKIYEVMKIINDSYFPEYTYQVKFIPYGAKYEVSVQAKNNGMKGGIAKANITTDDLGTHISQSPKDIGANDRSITFKLTNFDPRLDNYTMKVFVQDFNKDAVRNFESIMKKDRDNLCHDFGDTWLAKVVTVNKNGPTKIEIGTADETDKQNSKSNNKPLKPDTKYCFTFIITNNYRSTEHDVVYYETGHTLNTPAVKKASSGGSNNHLYALLLFLLVIPVGFAIHWYLKNRKRPRKMDPSQQDNVYESLPFEDCEENSVNNFTYDKLLHK